MAEKYEYFLTSVLYPPCAPGYGERGYFYGNPTSFRRKSKDTATVTVSVATEITRHRVAWSGNGWRYLWQESIVDGINLGRATGTQHDNCSDDWGNPVRHSGSYSFTQTKNNKTNVHINGRSGYQTASGESSFYWVNDNGWSDLVVNLSNSYLILPPKGLSGSVVSKNSRQVKVRCSLSSWSDNPNIGGTPYTAGGGRTWNFQAKLKNGNSVIATLTKNTGETKNAEFTFNDLDLPLDKQLTVEFTASNNYQQTVVTNVNFTVPSMGWVVGPAGSKKIKYITVTDALEDGGSTRYVSNVKEIH